MLVLSRVIACAPLLVLVLVLALVRVCVLVLVLVCVSPVMCPLVRVLVTRVLPTLPLRNPLVLPTRVVSINVCIPGKKK